MTEIVRDESDHTVEIPLERGVSARVKGYSVEKAMELFGTLCAWKFACAVKHLGGYYFVEVPVGLRGDPCYQEVPRIMELAHNAGLKTLQTGQTLRIIG